MYENLRHAKVQRHLAGNRPERNRERLLQDARRTERSNDRVSGPAARVPMVGAEHVGRCLARRWAAGLLTASQNLREEQVAENHVVEQGTSVLLGTRCLRRPLVRSHLSDELLERPQSLRDDCYLRRHQPASFLWRGTALPPCRLRRDQARSNRSRFMTLSHASTKSWTNFC